jgi:hypothetical protein
MYATDRPFPMNDVLQLTAYLAMTCILGLLFQIAVNYRDS